MNINTSFKIVTLFLLIFSFVYCHQNASVEPVLSVSENEISFAGAGGESALKITCDDQWSISNSAISWLQLDQTNGSDGTFTIKITTLSTNNTGAIRSTVLNINSSNGQSRRVLVSQATLIYPSYNTSPKEPDSSGMSSNALELAAKMGLGINIGNTLEAPGGENGWEGNNLGWNPMVTEEYVLKLKESGFNAVRIPCGWNISHLADKDKALIDANWMNRVKEVIGYCVSNNMYVLLNIHWDGGWLENNCTTLKKDSVNAKQKAFWEQIATAMRDFDEHLMFASANEPNTSNSEEMSVLLSYHQTFVDAVRSTGGRNSYRVLVIQGDAELFGVDDFPTDPTPNRMMYEWHNYTPYQFCALGDDASWGKMFYYWGAGNHSTIEPERNATWGEEEEQIKGFEMLQTDFLDKGIPVLLGEYGAYRRGNSANVPKDLEKHNASVDYWNTFVTTQATSRGVVPFFWDTGAVFNRTNATVNDQRLLDAILAGAAE